jgi:RNA 2',3'-cyclic 3'-phosphodiesterase
MFVALDLPEAARSAIAAWRDGLVSGRTDLRPVRVEALHVTLAFLGWQREKDAERIAAAAFGAADGLAAPVVRPLAVKPIPPRGGPRLFALDLEDRDGACGALQDAVSRALATERFYRPEKRPFWPHVTLARVKRDVRRAAPLPGDDPPGRPFEARELVLYRSILRPQGAQYDALARVEL